MKRFRVMPLIYCGTRVLMTDKSLTAKPQFVANDNVLFAV